MQSPDGKLVFFFGRILRSSLIGEKGKKGGEGLDYDSMDKSFWQGFHSAKYHYSGSWSVRFFMGSRSVIAAQ